MQPLRWTTSRGRWLTVAVPCGLVWFLATASPPTAVKMSDVELQVAVTPALRAMVEVSRVEAKAAAAPAPVSLVGVIAKTHAVRHPTPGGFGNTLEFTFVRFLEHDQTQGELTIRYQYEWDTASPEHFEQAGKLLGEQALSFATPSDEQRARGYQTSAVTLKVADHEGDEDEVARQVRHFKIVLLAPAEGRYAVVDEMGKLVRELNRRYAEREAECSIYEGCVIACLPNDQPSSAERHPVDAHDLDQFVPDCYLIAALVAAVCRDPDHVRNLILQSPDGYLVTFPGQPPVAVPLDLDRGPDMVEARALDVNSRGEVELWPVLLERAFLVLRSREKVNGAGPGQEFQDVGDGDAQSAYYILTGRHITEHTRPGYRSRQAQLRAIRGHLESARPVMMSTGKWTQPGDRPQWWLEDHVYVIAGLGANTITAIDPSCGQLVERIKIGDWFDSTEVKRFLFCE